MASVFSLDLPERRRNYRFSLTPLADAMFQLLIFFMLSSGLTPYALLNLQSAPGQAETPSGGVMEQTEETPAADQPDEGPRDTALWTIESEAVVVGGQRFGYEDLDKLAGALGTPAVPGSVVLIVRPSAAVQDMTTVMARLAAANVTAVQISVGEGR